MMTMLEEAKKQLDAAARYSDIDPESWEILQFPKRTIQVSLPMRHDDGTLRIYKAYRSQYSDGLGPTKGGVRYHPTIDRDHCEALAFWMTFKTAALKIPFGGAKGGICIDAKTLSHRELERISKAYIDAFADFIGPDSDIPAPDMYTDERVMGWMYAEYRKIKGGHPKDVITGKPIALGGIEGRNSATGYGGYYVLETILNDYFGKGAKLNFKGNGIALQGFGKVGTWFAEICYRKGMKVVAISNEYGATFDPEGLDVPKCLKKIEASCGKEWGQGIPIRNEDLLQLDVDILVPAAIENVITEKNAEGIRAKVIFELANGPTSNAADAILKDRGVLVIPDILANAGGVVVSYFEWVQNRNGVVKTLNEVNGDLSKYMKYATNRVMEIYQKYDRISLRSATYALALKRIATANECLGNKNYFGRST